MEHQSLKTKLLILALFIILVVSAAVGIAMCTKKQKSEPGSLFPEFTITYTSDSNGYLTGNTTQTVRKWHDDGTDVTAVPYDGYIFAGWSDNVLIPTRKDSDATQNKEVKATFISKNKTLKYDYNGATSNNTTTSITLNYDNVTDTTFVIPQKANYEFQGWYLDKEFKRRVTDKDGVYYLGKSIFHNDADTIYARWQKRDDIVYPILMIFAYEADASLKIISNGIESGIFNVKYEFSVAELKICEEIPIRMANYLNNAFDGNVYFEIDCYYTNIPITEKNYSDYIYPNKTAGADIYPPLVYEVAHLLNSYRSVITVSKYCYKDDRYTGGSAKDKYANLDLDLNCYDIDFSKPLEINKMEWAPIIGGYLHEFAHTIEAIESLNFDISNNGSFHNYCNNYRREHNEDLEDHQINCTLYFLLNFYPEYGKGIPFDYWSGTYDIYVHYITDLINPKAMGSVKYIDEQELCPNIHQTILYGSNLTIEAVAYEGYRFVKWSDGVTTAIRHDTNITSKLVVYAIFEEIK